MCREGCLSVGGMFQCRGMSLCVGGCLGIGVMSRCRGMSLCRGDVSVFCWMRHDCMMRGAIKISHY